MSEVKFLMFMIPLLCRTIWNPDQITRNISRRDHRSSNFEVTIKDSLEDKLKFLEVDSTLKASALFGFVTLRGSAGYLNDHRTSTSVSRVTLMYHAETHFEQLTMVHFNKSNIRYPSVLGNNEVTHVVVGQYLFLS